MHRTRNFTEITDPAPSWAPDTNGLAPSGARAIPVAMS